jgi:outer membrane beta-barrel protein
MRRLAPPILTLALSVTAMAAETQTDEIEEPPRIFSIQPRPYRLGHEFQLGIGVLPLDAFYVGVVPFASYTYHFTDFWAWEIAGAGYSLNVDTGLMGELRSKYDVVPVGFGGSQIQVLATTSAIIKPLFGKLAIFNGSVIFSETFFSVGVGGIKKGDYNYATGVLGVGVRFWASQILSFRFDVRDYLVFARLLPDNTLLLLLSASLNYYDRPEKPRS